MPLLRGLEKWKLRLVEERVYAEEVVDESELKVARVCEGAPVRRPV